MTPVRRALAALGALLLLVAVWACWVGWTAWQVRGELEQARAQVSDARAALAAGDAPGARRAVEALRDSAGAAADRTDGPAWGLATLLPVVGDDAAGVRALSASLDVLAADGFGPALRAEDSLEAVLVDGGLDLDAVRRLDGPVTDARDAVREAARGVREVDSAGFVGPLRSAYDDYAGSVTDLEAGMDAASLATRLLPRMAGGEGVRHYLLLVQNNAEVRATGGLPGAYVVIRADDGRLEITRQGVPADFRSPARRPVLALSDAELAVYDEQLGTYFGDAVFTPDFPRAAALVRGHWRADRRDIGLDGVLSVDPVALGYLLDSIPPVEVDGRPLTRATVRRDLLNRPYRELDPEGQDALFASAARDVFEAATTGPVSVPGLLRGLARAVEERRLLLAPVRDGDAELLAGTAVTGALSGDDGATPHVDVALNDATGSKMSYYLRYDAAVTSEGCGTHGQRLAGTLELRSTVDPGRLATLPTDVTGGGYYGTPAGEQLVLVRVYGPYGGTVQRVRVDDVGVPSEQVQLDGRPVVTVPVLLGSKRPVEVAWQSATTPEQTGDVVVGLTPGILPGSGDSVATSSCGGSGSGLEAGQ